ncbi:hypothetical protein ACQI4E_29640 [Streptomyces sp. CA-252508]|uniref:hypothetical protein n=1 Tax=Streptomyces sp. CA-252508 TaxID=3418946 RepID=UPI003D8C185D
MTENTVTTPLAPMEPQDVADAFAFIQAIHAADIDTAGAVADEAGPELHRMLLDVAARVFIPITAADDHDGEPCEHSFLAAALGRLLLELLCHSVCLASARGMADTIVRFTENILTENHSDVGEALRHRSCASGWVFRLGERVLRAAIWFRKRGPPSSSTAVTYPRSS